MLALTHQPTNPRHLPAVRRYVDGLDLELVRSAVRHLWALDAGRRPIFLLGIDMASAASTMALYRMASSRGRTEIDLIDVVAGAHLDTAAIHESIRRLVCFGDSRELRAPRAPNRRPQGEGWRLNGKKKGRPRG